MFLSIILLCIARIDSVAMFKVVKALDYLKSNLNIIHRGMHLPVQKAIFSFD